MGLWQLAEGAVWSRCWRWRGETWDDQQAQALLAQVAYVTNLS